MLPYGVELGGDIISLSAWNEIEKFKKVLSHRQLGVKSSTSYLVMLLEIGAQPIKVLTMHKLYMYITNIKDMPDHNLAKKDWNIRCKEQETNNSRNSHLVGCLTSWNGLKYLD